MLVHVHPLPETCYMPCVRRFAESHNTGTRQRTSLPSAWSPTLGKPEAHAIIHIYRVPALGKQMALGKIWICRVPRSGHTAKPAYVLVMRDGRHVRLLCRVLPVWHSAKWDFVECLFQALGKVQFYPKKLWPTGESSPRPPAYQKPTLTIAP